MIGSKANEALHGAMEDQACFWIARLNADSASDEDRREFALWLAASPTHRMAMDAMLDLWEDLEVVRHRPLPELHVESRDRISRRRWLGTGIALAASVLVAMVLSPGLSLGPDSQGFRTQLGEQLAVKLADGSRVQLNTDSALDVHFDRSERRLTLQRGEAFFQVSHDSTRPFLVTAGHTEVRALGTAFNILLKGERSEVTVTEGTVRITELDAPATRPAQVEVLHENQRLAADRHGLEPLAAVEAGNLLAWRDGKLVAQGMPLAELVAELSRYHPTEIIISEPGLADRTVSGVFQLEDLDSILLALEHTVEVRSVPLEDGSIQLIRAPL